MEARRARAVPLAPPCTGAYRGAPGEESVARTNQRR